jgi:hypothetical protein
MKLLGGRAAKLSRCRCRRRWLGRSIEPSKAILGAILRNNYGAGMDRHVAARRLKHVAESAGIRMPRMHPHMLRHTFVTTMLDAGVSLAAFRSLPATLIHARPCATTMCARTSTGTTTRPSPHTWRLALEFNARNCRRESVVRRLLDLRTDHRCLDLRRFFTGFSVASTPFQCVLRDFVIHRRARL